MTQSRSEDLITLITQARDLALELDRSFTAQILDMAIMNEAHESARRSQDYSGRKTPPRSSAA